MKKNEDNKTKRIKGFNSHACFVRRMEREGKAIRHPAPSHGVPVAKQLMSSICGFSHSRGDVGWVPRNSQTNTWLKGRELVRFASIVVLSHRI